MDEIEKIFEVMDPEELDEWVEDFMIKSDGKDLDAICTMTMALEAMHAFINQSDLMRKQYMRFSVKHASSFETEVLH